MSVGVEADKAQEEKRQGANKNVFHVVRNFECCRKFVGECFIRFDDTKMGAPTDGVHAQDCVIGLRRYAYFQENDVVTGH